MRKGDSRSSITLMVLRLSPFLLKDILRLRQDILRPR
jgi:hypothetical protein